VSPLVVTFDLIALMGFTVAFGLAVATPVRPDMRFAITAKWGLMTAMLIYVAVNASNVMEHSGLTDAFDIAEDYAEVLFVPLLAYVAYAFAATAQLNEAHAVQGSLRRERDLSASIVNTSPAGVVVVSQEGEVRFASDRAREMLGEALDAPHAPVFAEHDGDLARSFSLAQLAAAAPFRDKLVDPAPGSESPVFSASAERMAEPVKPDTVIAFVDVTERVQSAAELSAYRKDLEGLVETRTQELKTVNDELVAANSAKRDFLANMSHELRTPLNSIIGFTGVMLRGFAGSVTDEQRTQLQMIDRSGRQLLELINDVLDISRIEAGRASVTFEDVVLKYLLEQTVEALQPLARERGIDLGVEWESTTLMVRTDPEKLEQVVRNIVSNAVKFTGEAGRVRVRATDAEDAVLIEVIDNGQGISLEDKGRVFEAFYQGPGHEVAKTAGTGLGLAIARELCELIGAKISFTSIQGEGTTFTVKLPHSQL
jgi:signal transduction histidine kinase